MQVSCGIDPLCNAAGSRKKYTRSGLATTKAGRFGNCIFSKAFPPVAHEFCRPPWERKLHDATSWQTQMAKAQTHVCAKRFKIKVWLLILEVTETWSITFKADLRIPGRSVERKNIMNAKRVLQLSVGTRKKPLRYMDLHFCSTFPAYWLCMKVCEWANVTRFEENWRSWLQKRPSRSRGIKPATLSIIGLPALLPELRPPLELQMLTNATWCLFTFVNEASIELDNR